MTRKSDLKDFVDAAATGIIKRQTMSDAVDESGVGIHSSHDSARPVYRTNQDFAKVCAKFLGGVRWGIGMRMERACRPDTCITGKCSGSLLQRACRLWDFVPHYKVSTLSGPAVRPSPVSPFFVRQPLFQTALTPSRRSTTPLLASGPILCTSRSLSLHLTLKRRQTQSI